MFIHVTKSNTLRYFLFNKPYGCLSQFTGEESDDVLGNYYNYPKDVYSVGRLDKDSEGLLLLTNDNRLKNKLLDPLNEKPKTYLVQVEGAITEDAVQQLKAGNIELKHKGKSYKTQPCNCSKIDTPTIWERSEPIRFRQNIPTSWIEITITEGKNRQVRKMTAAVGFPTLRLIRTTFDQFQLEDLKPGEVKEVTF